MIIFNIVWIIVCFIIPIYQSYFSTLLVDKNGKFTIKPLLSDWRFWIALLVCIIGNFVLIMRERKQKDHEWQRKWLKQKEKMVDDVRKKAKRGDYSGANETIMIIEKLDSIVKEDKDAK